MKPEHRPTPVKLFKTARVWMGRATVAHAVLLGSLLLTVLAWYYVSRNIEAQERLHFEEIVGSTQEAVDRRMSTYIDAMLDGRGLFAASSSVGREEWRDYVAASDLMNRYPGIQAICYAPRVTPGELESHIEGVRAEGFPGYSLRPPGDRYEYFPMTYVEPFEGRNAGLFGYDVYSDSVSRAAMEQARDMGLPRASGKVLLPTGKNGVRASAFLVFTPVYKGGGAPPGDTVERRRALQGFIVSVFRPQDLLGNILRKRDSAQVDLEVFDGADFTRARLLHDADGVLRTMSTSRPPKFSRYTTLEVAGRIWSLHFITLPGFGRDWQHSLPLFVFLSGLAVSVLLFSVTWALTRSRTEAERTGAQLEVANRELEEANKELEATNRELEAFSYSVSHDLRAPLRSINGFSQMLLEDYEDVLDETGRDYLRRVRSASGHMGKLIDDLLALSRVTRADMHRERVDLSAMAREISGSLREEAPGRDVAFVIAGGLTATGDERLLAVALENLLGNAWKFTGKKEHARIEFGATAPHNGLRTYYVRDDGAGFDMAYAGKLFGAFQRLHRAEEFEGTGIGLATVQRIIRRHGGRIWAEGVVGEGATFYFTLPEDGGGH